MSSFRKEVSLLISVFAEISIWLSGKEKRKGEKAYARTKGIYRRGKIYWIRYAGLDEKIVFESSHSEKFKAAETLLTKRKRTIDEGKQPEIIKKIGNHTFNELVAEYIKWAERQRCYKSKSYLIEQLKETFGILPLRRSELIGRCDSHVKPIVIAALNSGMRKTEILSLKWENVDLKHGFILLDHTKNGDRREIPINTTLRTTFQGISRRLDCPHVFYDPSSGKPYADVKRSFKTALKHAKITDFKFHDLRHTFASHLVMAGVDLTTVKELLGHKDIKMTLRYAHLAPAHKVRQ